MKLSTVSLAVLAAVAVAGPALAQRSPRGSASAEVAGKKVALDYGRPALKGRTLEALLQLLPPDRIWRAGENQVTTFTTEGDVLVGGKKVPHGKYSLYVHVGEKDAWDLVLNKDLGVPLGTIYPGASERMRNEPWPHYTDYTKAIAASEVARVPMKTSQTSQPADPFSIAFTPKGPGQELTLAWGTQAWSVEVQPAK